MVCDGRWGEDAAAMSLFSQFSGSKINKECSGGLSMLLTGRLRMFATGMVASAEGVCTRPAWRGPPLQGIGGVAVRYEAERKNAMDKVSMGKRASRHQVSPISTRITTKGNKGS